MRVALLQASDAPGYRALMLQAYELAADAFTSTAAERAAEPELFWATRITNLTGFKAKIHMWLPLRAEVTTA